MFCLRNKKINFLVHTLNLRPGLGIIPVKGARWLCGRVLEIEGSWGRASLEALCCVLEEDNYPLLSTGSTQEDSS